LRDECGRHRREAFELQARVVDTDLGRPGCRWPSFAAAVCERGVDAVFTYPLSVATTTFGGLTL
jgi:hypothetical protein